MVVMVGIIVELPADFYKDFQMKELRIRIWLRIERFQMKTTILGSDLDFLLLRSAKISICFELVFLVPKSSNFFKPKTIENCQKKRK